MEGEDFSNTEGGNEFPPGSEVRLKRNILKKILKALFPEFLPNVTYTVDRQEGNTVWVYSDESEDSYPIHKKHLERFYH